MAHTNETTNYNLPQFIGEDKPAWLTDINQGYATIDAAMAANRTSAQQAAQAAGAAQTTADTANSAASAATAAASSAQLTANQTAADLLTLQSRVTSIEDDAIKLGNVKIQYTVANGTSGEGFIRLSRATLPANATILNIQPTTRSISASKGMQLTPLYIDENYIYINRYNPIAITEQINIEFNLVYAIPIR